MFYPQQLKTRQRNVSPSGGAATFVECFFGHRTLWTWKRKYVVRGSVKRGCVMQDAEVQGATWTRRLMTSRMS